jgi:carboxypeptidase D
MLFSSSLLALLGLSATVSALNPAEKAFAKAQRPKKPVIEKRVPHQEFKDARLRKRAHNFLNNGTEQFVVNGTGLPDVPFDIGESYAGLLPISGDKNETRELFFW